VSGPPVRQAPRRAALIVNPRSGSDRAAALLPHIRERLQTRFASVDVCVIERPDDAERAARRAADERCDGLFVAGGDGTLNLALRGLHAVPDGLGRLPIGLIPCGTGNDFARALGLGTDPIQALEWLLDASIVRADVGLINGRPFVNTSAGGFVADVSSAVTEALKDATGRLAYIIGGARALLGREPFTLEIVAATLPHGGASAGPFDVRMFVVCNSRTIGGGYPIAPRARIDDGLLDVFVVMGVPTLEFIAVLQRIAAGQHAGDDRVVHFRASSFELRFNRTVRVNTDGEVFEADACRYAVLHEAARFYSRRSD
jgi:diacylglycerol kinase (ATP)